MNFWAAGCVTVVLCFDFVVGEVTVDEKNSTKIENSSVSKIPDGPKESNQRRRGMESEMAYPQRYFPPFGGDFQPSTTPFNHPVRRESVPIIVERRVNSQPAIIRNPSHRTIVSNVFNTHTVPQQVYFQTVPTNEYQRPNVMYQPTEFTGTSYVQKPLFQQPEYQTYASNDDQKRYQVYQVPQLTVVNRYPSEPNYQPQYGLQSDIGYTLTQPENSQTLEREIQTLRELEEQHRRLVQQINARTQGVLYYNSDSSMTRKVLTQYPNDQNIPQYSTTPSYSNPQSTLLIMDPSNGVTSGNPYNTNQIRISRHPGQTSSPEIYMNSRRGTKGQRKANVKLVKAKMAIPVVVGLEMPPNDQGVWNYVELQSTKRFKSIFQSGLQKPSQPFPELLPPCPGGFLCDDTVLTPDKGEDDGHTVTDTPRPSKNDEDLPNQPDRSTENPNGPAGVDEDKTSERPSTESTADSESEDDPEKGIVFPPDGSEEPEDDSTINLIDPRSSTSGPDFRKNGIVYKMMGE